MMVTLSLGIIPSINQVTRPCFTLDALMMAGCFILSLQHFFSSLWRSVVAKWWSVKEGWGRKDCTQGCCSLIHAFTANTRLRGSNTIVKEDGNSPQGGPNVEAATWSAIAAFFALFTSVALVFIHYQNLQENVRPNLVLVDWDLRKHGEGDAVCDVLRFKTIKNIGKGGRVAHCDKRLSGSRKPT